MHFLPFRALRPPQNKAALVASPPYDVVSAEEARAIAEDNPHSFMHVIRAEADLAPDVNPYSEDVYARAKENFRAMQADGLLLEDSQEHFYWYEQSIAGHSQLGLVGCCRVEDYEQDRIKKHEKTRPAKEDDRTRLCSALSAHPGPVFLTFPDNSEFDALAATARDGTPAFDFVAEDGVRHRGWLATGNEEIMESLYPVPSFYVADGHHRSASAARVGRERRLANPVHTGREHYNRFLCVLFPASQLKVLAYNRLVLDLRGEAPSAFLRKLSEIAEVSEDAPDVPAQPGVVSLYLGEGRWYGLRLPSIPGKDNDPVAQLDVSRLQETILAPLLGIGDPRTDERIEFVGGIRGTSFLKDKVDSGEAAIAFSLYPTTVRDLMQVSDAGLIMPPKSTWFEPKLRSGLFVHTFEEF